MSDTAKSENEESIEIKLNPNEPLDLFTLIDWMFYAGTPIGKPVDKAVSENDEVDSLETDLSRAESLDNRLER